ncbi:MAG: VTT domain-containing protein [Myxococcota bacterium]
MSPLAEEALAGLGLALGTFVLEDAATVSGGLLVAAGEVRGLTAFVALVIGIVVGDVGLYMLGKIFGARAARWLRIDVERWSQAQTWLKARLPWAVIGSRFVPGARLPTYLAAGGLDVGVVRFAKWAIGASVAWTSLLLGLTWLLGERLLPLLGPGKGIIAVVVVVGGLVFLVGRQARRWAEASARSNPDRTRSSFEFWPPFLFYIPVALDEGELFEGHGEDLASLSVGAPIVENARLVRMIDQGLHHEPRPRRKGLEVARKL